MHFCQDEAMAIVYSIPFIGCLALRAKMAWRWASKYARAVFRVGPRTCRTAGTPSRASQEFGWVALRVAICPLVISKGEKS